MTEMEKLRAMIVVLVFMAVVSVIAFICGYAVEQQVWLAHCANVMGSQLCSAP